MKPKTVLHSVRLAKCVVLLMILGLKALAKDVATDKISVKADAFIENKGQITDQYGNSRADVDFVIKGKGFSMFAGSGKLHYQFTKTAAAAIDPEVLAGYKKMHTQANDKTEMYRMDITLVNANTQAQVVKEERVSYYERYYYPSLGKDGVTAKGYRKITYKNIYPQIDWVLYINEGTAAGVKYDFVVRPGGNPADIKLKYDGETSLQLVNNGIVASTPFGSVTEKAPYSYDALTKQEVPSSFILSEDILGFQVGAHNGTLVIDPTIAWSTYFGGPDLEFGYSVATDTGGNSFLAGHTNSTTSIATTGAFATSFFGNKDGYLAKFDKDGNLLWATYYGGTGSDNFFYIATDTLGCVYASGITASSTGIATTGAYQTVYGGGVSDAYLVKFSPSGSRLWATYFGGGGDEAIVASFDDYMVSTAWCKYNNRVYLCGMTTSTGNISTSSSYQPALSGGADGYLAQFTANGSLLWATYYGGSNDDKIIKMACNDSGHVYVTGPTYSTTSIASVGAHQTTLGGSADAFVAKFDAAGLRIWGTYCGGGNLDEPAGIAIDNVGSVYIAGSTQSVNGIATTGAFQQTLGGSTGATDAFLEKFDPSGVRMWGTYFGGAGPDHTADIAIDATGNVCFSGFTGSTGIATPGAYQYTFGGNSDAFIAIFGPGGTRTWVSYLGGNDAETSCGISYSRTGDLFIAGHTNSPTNIASTGAYQTMLNGVEDAFLSKFKADTSAFVQPSFSPLIYCAGDSMFVPYGITNPFLTGNVFTVQLSNSAGNFNTPVTIGTRASNTPGVIACKIPPTMPGGAGYRIRIAYTNPAGVGFDNATNINIKLLPEKPVLSSNSPVCSGNDLTIAAQSSTAGVTYQWTGPNLYTSTKQLDTFYNAITKITGTYTAKVTLQGCWTQDSFAVAVDSTPEPPVVASNTPVCMTDTIALVIGTATTGVTYSWTGPANFTSTSQNPNILSATTAKKGWYYGTVHLGACSNIDSTEVDVINILTPTITTTSISPGTQICIGDNINFSVSSANGGPNARWQWFVNGVAVSGGNWWSWSSTSLNTGDEVYCVFYGDWPCLTRPTDTSTKYIINASGNVLPGVTVKVSPSLTVPTGTVITFVATPINGGNSPSYVWRKNGVVVKSGKSNVLMVTVDKDVKSGDLIDVAMISDLTCANPDSAYSTKLMIGDNIIISGVSNTASDLYRIYPNPAKDQLVIEGLRRGMDIQLVDVLGKVTVSTKSAGDKDVLNVSALVPGTYILHFRDESGNHTVSKAIISR